MKACKKCKIIVEKGSKCPICKSKDLSTSYKGEIIIFDPNNSKIAKEINAKTPGTYAIRVK